MESTNLYQQILGLATPWRVIDVQLNLPEKSVHVKVEHDGVTPRPCPECGKVCPGYDTAKKSWRHLDTCQMHTILTAEVPRTQCPEHGVKMIRVPWAERGSRFTALFEAVVIDWLKAASIKEVAARMGLSWGQAALIQERAVERGLARRTPVTSTRIAVDETSFQKRHEYVTVVADLDSGAVLHVGDERKAEALEAWYRTLDAAQLGAVKVVTMDMWQPYIAATRRHVPEAEKRIVFDKYHVAAHLGAALDKVRRREQRELRAQDDQRLTGTRHLWLSNPGTLTARLSEEQQARFDELRRGKLRTARAYALKEGAMELWEEKTREDAEQMWRWWNAWAMRSRLEPIKRTARMIKANLYGILNAIVTGATNAIAESINAKIQKVKRMACGFRNRERFRNAIYFHLGDLDLYPALPTHSKP